LDQPNLLTVVPSSEDRARHCSMALLRCSLNIPLGQFRKLPKDAGEREGLRKRWRRQVEVTRRILPIRLSYRFVIKILNGGGKQRVDSAVGFSGSDREQWLAACPGLTAPFPVPFRHESSEQCLKLVFDCGLRTVMIRRFVVKLHYYHQLLNSSRCGSLGVGQLYWPPWPVT
jgi:hypothetical protein